MKIINKKDTKIIAKDEPAFGAHHDYYIYTKGDNRVAHIKFQRGPINEVGVNGCSIEDLLTIVIDRLSDFQDGEFKCKENEDALLFSAKSLKCLEDRTANRIKRNVEGKFEK